MAIGQCQGGARQLGLGAAICLVLFCGALAVSEPCSSSNDSAYYMNSKHGHYRFHGNTMSAWPRNPATGQLIEAGRLDYQMMAMLEVPLRTVSGRAACQKFQAFSFSPDLPTAIDSLPKKVLNMTAESTSCLRERKTLSIGPNATADSVVLSVTSTEVPSMRFSLTFAVPDIAEPVPIRTYDPQATTSFLPLDFQFMYGTPWHHLPLVCKGPY